MLPRAESATSTRRHTREIGYPLIAAIRDFARRGVLGHPPSRSGLKKSATFTIQPWLVCNNPSSTWGISNYARGDRDVWAFGTGRLRGGCRHHRPAKHVRQHG